ncbi:MAG: M23 family metallopeptidase [Pseudomonadota bacterium]
MACSGATQQGGLLVCSVPEGDMVSLIGPENNLIVRVPVQENGTATIGLRRDAPEQITITSDTPNISPVTIDIERRTDPFRTITGLDCDKVDARTDAQKAHAGRSWVKKQAAFKTFHDGPGASAGFLRPAIGPSSSPFGPARKYIGVGVDGEPCESTSIHRGYDIAVPIGTEIRAPADGTVTLGDPDLYYEGGTVFLDHGDGLVSVFMHMSKVEVSVGDQVRVGDRLGASGNTGRTTGPHLHWAVKWRNTGSEDRSADFYIDPALLMDLEPTS